MAQSDTIITIGALPTFRRTGITDIISTAGGIVIKIGVRMTSKIPGCFRLTSQSGPETGPGWPQAGIKKSRAFEYCRRASASVGARPDALGFE